MFDVLGLAEFAGPTAVEKLASGVFRLAVVVSEKGDLFAPVFHVVVFADAIAKGRKCCHKRDLSLFARDAGRPMLLSKSGPATTTSGYRRRPCNAVVVSIRWAGYPIIVPGQTGEELSGDLTSIAVVLGPVEPRFNHFGDVPRFFLGQRFRTGDCFQGFKPMRVIGRQVVQ